MMPIAVRYDRASWTPPNTYAMLIVIWIVLIGLYYLLPGSGYNGTRELLRLLVALVLVGVVFA